MLEDHLALAERQVALGTRDVAEERERIAQMAKEGLDTESAVKVLNSVLETRRQHMADRSRIRKELRVLVRDEEADIGATARGAPLQVS